MPKKKQQNEQRNVALCYIRQSVTKDDNDNTSPERQRTNIERVCAEKGWTPEWYEDVGGHRSGTSEKNRPEWQKLVTRLHDSDVVAVIANDLSRFHRRGWRVGELLELTDKQGLNLILADPARHIDFNTPAGRTMAQFIAMMDEWYAMEISQRASSSVGHRKAQGISIGMTPFGTERPEKKFLKPTKEGAWLMPDIRFVAGDDSNNPPHPDAIWRGYYEAAERVLRLYAQNTGGVESIAAQMRSEGWAYRDRAGKPTVFEHSDVRRIVANWAEYGGHVSKTKARDRHAHEFSPDNVTLYPERAVFDIELLKQVGNVRRQRATKPRDRGQAQTDYPYPLTGITYCAHCERRAIQENDPKMRSRLGGKSQKRYRHRAGYCDCERKSVQRELLEGDFQRLIKALAIDPKYLNQMEELALNAASVTNGKQDRDLEKEKKEGLAKARMKIENAKHLALEGIISYEECLRHIEAGEREIVLWQAQTTEREKIAMSLALCAEAVNQLATMWDDSDDAERRGMVHHLFECIVYDLDKQEIVEYQLKAWAEQFLTLRVALYLEGQENKKDPHIEGTNLPHKRLELLFPP